MINVDLTTKNTVYNTLSPQAQWVQHRFGRRDYPELEIDLDCVKSVIEHSDDTINFISIFGDPSQHTKIHEILECVPQGKVVFNSHLNFTDNLLIEILNKKHAYVVVPCYGIDDLADKIALRTDWQQVESNLKYLKCTVCIEFYLFEHNFHQLDAIQTLCNTLSLELKIKRGTSLHPAGYSPIVDENKNWLYDVYSCDETVHTIKWPTLNQTVNGYNNLIHFIKDFSGASILNRPNFYKITKEFKVDNISVSSTGHVFPSFDLHQIFSNALCTDWNFSFSNITKENKISIKPEYNHICAALTTIEKMLKFNSLNDNQYTKILANFTDSNI